MAFMDKILFIFPEYSYGGAERQLSYLANGLSDVYEIHCIICNSYGCMKEKKFFNDKIIVDCELNLNEKKYISIFKSKIKLDKYLKNNYKSKEFCFAFVYTNLGLICINEINKISKTVIFCERNSGDKNVNSFLRRHYLNKFGIYVCNSDYSFELYKNSNLKNVYLVKNGIEIPYFEKETIKFNSAIVPARISKVKNQLFVVDCINKLPFDLYLAGPIEDREYYEAVLLSIKGNENKCKYIGVVENADDLYLNYDLVILPSLSEGTPNVILEAFARKTFVIASNITMNKCLFSDENLLFDNSDSDSFIKCVNYINSLSNDDINEVIERNYEFVKNEYSLEKMTKSYKDILEKYKK